MGLLSLAKKHPSESLEKACETALSHGAFRLRTIRQLLKRADFKQEPLPFLEEHPIIRPLDDYAQVVAAAIERQGSRFAAKVLRGMARAFNGRLSKAESPGGQQSNATRARLPGTASAFTPPRSGYPSPGCSSAEPDSVSPDSSILRSSPSSTQERNHE